MMKTKTDSAEVKKAPNWVPILTGPDTGCYIDVNATDGKRGTKNGHAYTLNEEGTGWNHDEETIPNGL